MSLGFWGWSRFIVHPKIHTLTSSSHKIRLKFRDIISYPQTQKLLQIRLYVSHKSCPIIIFPMFFKSSWCTLCQLIIVLCLDTSSWLVRPIDSARCCLTDKRKSRYIHRIIAHTREMTRWQLLCTLRIGRPLSIYHYHNTSLSLMMTDLQF